MFRKLVTVLLVALMINLAGVRLAYADSREEKQARFAEKIKANLLKLGTGEQARVKVKLRDQTKLEGYIIEAGEETFTVTNRKTGVATTVAYPQVKKHSGQQPLDRREDSDRCWGCSSRHFYHPLVHNWTRQ